MLDISATKGVLVAPPCPLQPRLIVIGRTGSFPKDLRRTRRFYRLSRVLQNFQSPFEMILINPLISSL